MFALRCTKKLPQRIEPSARHEEDVSTSSTTLGDWAANLVIVRRQQLVLAVSHVTLLPVILPLAPSKTFVPRFPEALGQVLQALGVEQQKVSSEVSAMNECMVTKTNDRRVLGSLNEFPRMLDFYLDSRTLVEVAVHLAETPCSSIGMESPRATTVSLFTKIGSVPKYPPLQLVRG